MHSVIHKPFRDVKNPSYFLPKNPNIKIKDRVYEPKKINSSNYIHCTGHIFIRYRIKIYSLSLLRISG